MSQASVAERKLLLPQPVRPTNAARAPRGMLSLRQTQRLQNPLLKDYTSNPSKDPPISEGKGFSESLGKCARLGFYRDHAASGAEFAELLKMSVVPETKTHET